MAENVRRSGEIEQDEALERERDDAVRTHVALIQSR
jgi:hypothetical protein